MGYYSSLTGRITITPPLRWAAVRDSQFLATRGNNSVCYEIDTITEDTEDGTRTIKRAVAVISAWEEAVKHYNAEEHLTAIAAEVIAAGSQLTGHLVRDGEETGDVERYSLDADGQVVTEKATLRWPDGSEVEL